MTLDPGVVVTLEDIILLQEVALGALETQEEMALEVLEVRGDPQDREEMTPEILMLGPTTMHHRRVEISKQP